MNRINGGNILIVGDLHFSDIFTGKHKNYLENCCWVVGEITAKIKEVKPSAIVLLGDIIGWRETNIKDRQILAWFSKTLKEWNSYCPVYSVKGNHDIKGYPDFLLFSDLGLIITSDMCGGYFDYYKDANATIPEVRFHIVDYGSENITLNLCEEKTCSNVVLGHNNYTINGVTTWYAEHDGIELGTLQNFVGVDCVISGHIHNPSPQIYSTPMVEGSDCMLLYPGCPTRPIKIPNMYNHCWFVLIGPNSDGGTQIDTQKFNLPKASEIFYEDDVIIEEATEEEVAEKMRKEALKNILDDLLQYRMQGGDPLMQIDMIPNTTTEAKELAKKYLQTAYNRG